MLASLGLFRRQRIDANPPPPRERTGGPPEENETVRRLERRIGFIRRKLDRVDRRLKRVEEFVQADAIAPLEEGPTPPSGVGR